MAPDTGVNGAWKWLAAILASILVTGTPGMIYALRTWSIASHVEKIQDRQDDVRIRLSILETEHDVMVDRIEQLRLELQAHTAQNK